MKRASPDARAAGFHFECFSHGLLAVNWIVTRPALRIHRGHSREFPRKLKTMILGMFLFAVPA